MCQSQNPDNDDTDDRFEDDNGEADDNSDSSSYLLRQTVIMKTWDTLYDTNDHLLFCSRNTSIDLSALHPNQIHIFKLWQIYLENVNPLLKVTHTPTLQSRIIDAAGNVARINPNLEALMFSIYCVAVHSITQTDCHTIFGLSRQDALANYQLGAREALLNCGFLKTVDLDCLTALHLYLVSLLSSPSRKNCVFLIYTDYRKTRHRCPVSFFNAWSRCSCRAAHGLA
jgi:hypothetical protein